VDFSKLSTPDKIIGGGAIVYLISMFLPWYGFGAFTNSGFSYFLGGIIPLILIAAVVARVAITRFSPDTKLPDLPVPWSQAPLGAAGAAAVIVLLRTIIGSDKVGSLSAGITFDRKYGLFIALLSSIAVAAGAFMKYQAKEDDAPAGGSTPPTPF
jgi:hypothetical protein